MSLFPPSRLRLLSAKSEFRRWRCPTRCFSSSASAPQPHIPLALLKNQESIVGTVPFHTSYTLLRHPLPPSTYPPKLDLSFSRLARELTVQAALRKGLVNFMWGGEVGSAVNDGGEERYEFVHFDSSSSKDSESESADSLPVVRVRKGVVTTAQVASFFTSLSPRPRENALHPLHDEIYLLVCTHGARDCRCGDKGGVLVSALRAELHSRRSRHDGDGIWDKIKVGEVAHVGGHKYAANLLVFPFGDWLGNLTPAHAPLILDTIASRLALHRDLADTTPLIVDPSLWRGRMGLSKDEQVALLEQYRSLPRE